MYVYVLVGREMVRKNRNKNMLFLCDEKVLKGKKVFVPGGGGSPVVVGSFFSNFSVILIIYALVPVFYTE